MKGFDKEDLYLSYGKFMDKVSQELMDEIDFYDYNEESDDERNRVKLRVHLWVYIIYVHCFLSYNLLKVINGK